MTDTLDTPDIDTHAVQAAVTRLRQARQMQLALEPVRHLLADIDEQLREALAAGEAIGMSQRVLAAQSGLAQPTVKALLDGRKGPITPPPSTAEHMWALHQSTTALDTLTRRLLGQNLPDRAPTQRHATPHRAITHATENLDVAAKSLAAAAAAMEMSQRTQQA